MELSIGEVSKLTGLTISKLRYYDEHGLIPNIKRTESGLRKFTTENMEALNLLECLKNSGMQLKEIKEFMNWCMQGDETIDKRLNMFNKQEKNVLKQIDCLNKSLDLIHFKQWYYSTAQERHSVEFVKNMKLEDMPDEIQKLYKRTHLYNKQKIS